MDFSFRNYHGHSCCFLYTPICNNAFLPLKKLNLTAKFIEPETQSSPWVVRRSYGLVQNEIFEEAPLVFIPQWLSQSFLCVSLVTGALLPCHAAGQRNHGVAWSSRAMPHKALPCGEAFPALPLSSATACH